MNFLRVSNSIEFGRLTQDFDILYAKFELQVKEN